MLKKIFALFSSLTIIGSVIIPVIPHQVVSAANYSSATEMRNFVRNTMDENSVRGSAVVIKNGRPQQISLGYAWYGKRIGNGNPKVVYPVCSLQKVVTGAMVVQLINEYKHTNKRFTQDTKISRWYPNLNNSTNITVGNLLTHTSGIMPEGTEVDRGKNYSEQEAINWAIDNVNNSSQDDIGKYHYNNTNYILLAGIISSVTGKSYEANFNKRIVNRLNLKNTYLYQGISKSKTDPISYYSDGSKNYTDPEWVKRSLASQIPGAGNMFSTPMEYYKIQLGLTNGQILDNSDFHYLTNLKSKNTNYSGGVYIKNDNLKMAYGNLANTHFGDWFQMSTDNKNGMILFLNQTDDDESNVKEIGYKILNHIKPNYFSEN